MERLSVMMLMCLLAGLHRCQAGGEDSQTQITEISDEVPEKNFSVEITDETFNEELQTESTLTSNTAPCLPTCEPNICMVLKELGALEERQKATERALEETNRKLEASEKQVAALNSTLTDFRSLYEGYFTAPVRGVYYFSFSSFGWNSAHTTGGGLFHNSRQIVSWYGYSKSHPSSGSNSAILLLQVGDMVNIRLWSQRMISDNGNNYCTFNGFLLFPV
ncbi:uncharacterized protein [Leuresthes tenuis]|uniref:uncharacterized protein n=1 Tax=Leuresthes tenuis TaxID=355514 RepID=UPI003B501AC1